MTIANKKNSPPVKGEYPEGGRGLVPKLRFPEFQDAGAWEEIPFGNIIKVNSGKGFKASEYSNVGIRLLQIENVGYGTTKWNENTTYLPISYTLEYPELVLQEGDIILALNRPVTNNELKIARLPKHDEPSLLYQRVGKLELLSDSLIDEFVFQICQRFIKVFVIKQSIGSDQPFISLRDLYAQKFTIPTPLEQQKIADCLSSIDERITAQTQKLDALKAHKKGLMQQLFPAEGETIPKLRFPEFQDAGEWEEKGLGDICKTFSGGTPTTTKKEFYEGDIPFIRSGEIAQDKTELFLTSEGLENSSAKLVKKGTVLVALYGANSGDVALAKLDGAINQAILCLESKVNNSFLYQFLALKKNWIISTYLQGGQGNLSGNIIKSARLSFPKEKEQQKIADCLSSIDELITAHAQKIDTLKAHKKGLMQQLFPALDDHPSKGGVAGEA